MTHLLPTYLPSPPINGFPIGPLFVHFYGLMYVVGILLAVYIVRRRWRAVGGDPELVISVVIWCVVAGVIGGRIYFDITTPFDIPHVWYGFAAIWDGGLGIWGGVVAGGAAGIWRVHRAGEDWKKFADAAAPALLVAQAIGRIGNYFNQELFGKPSTLPWAVEISPSVLAHSGLPAEYLNHGYRTFQPSFLYELIWDLALAAFLVWLGHHRHIRPAGLMALYVTGYSAYRIFEETIRIDSSAYFLGLRLNFFVAGGCTLAGIAWFLYTQLHHRSAVEHEEGAGTGAPTEPAEGDPVDGPARENSDEGDPADGPAEGDLADARTQAGPAETDPPDRAAAEGSAPPA